jgi:hypothetical protein
MVKRKFSPLRKEVRIYLKRKIKQV